MKKRQVKGLDQIKKALYNIFMFNRPTTKNLAEINTKLRPERDEEIRRYYEEYKRNPSSGWTINKLADTYGISKQRVWQIIKGE